MASPDNTSSSSPKSSTIPSSPQHPPPRSSSPRFSVFHRHFHSKSNSGSPPADAHSDMNVISAPTRTEAVRDAKQFLLSAVRDDWSFPQAHSPQSAEEEPQEPREPLEYRYREEWSSDVGADSDEPAGEAMLAIASMSDPYRFESPDAIAESMRVRRRKRRRLIQDEMQWNTGLRIWLQRRDAWTGAVWEGSPPSSTSNGRSNPLGNVPTGTLNRKRSDSTEISDDWPLSSHSPLQNSNPLLISSATPDPSVLTDESPVLLPVYPPLIPSSNPVRASIKPSIYSAIYSKVVVQGLTPTVPIPLPHMVAALVQGWKTEGTWPPKGGTPSMSIINEGPGSRRHAHGHMLRFRNDHEDANGHEKGRVRRHVGGAMRKALRFGRDGHDWDQPDGMGIEFEEDHKDEDAPMEVEKSGNVSDSFRVD